MKEMKKLDFANGTVYALDIDGRLVEVTDTHLPFYTKNAEHQKKNILETCNVGDRSERWMIGVSCMSGCPVGCKFCATGQMRGSRSLTAEQIKKQVDFVLSKNKGLTFSESMEYKINYTRMGEPFLNIEETRRAMDLVESEHPGTHHYISTIGINGSDFSWIRGNVTLQISVHSLDEKRRDELIPFKNKMSLHELGSIRTKSNLKTTVNLTLVDEKDFDIMKIKKYFDPDFFFIKLSPINPNPVSIMNCMGTGVIEQNNLL